MQTIVVHQMLIFFIIFAAGIFAVHRGILTKEGLPQLAKLVSKLLMPVWVFWASYNNITRKMVFNNWVILLIAGIVYLTLSLLSYLIVKVLHMEKDRGKAYRFTFTFGNLGMIGIPLLLYLFPETGGLYAALFSVTDQLLFWTLGLYLASPSGGKAPFSLKNFINPNIISILLGLTLACTGVSIGGFLTDLLVCIKNAFPVIGMLYLGALFACSNWKRSFLCKELYIGIFLKMILLPVMTGKLLFALTSLPDWIIYCTVFTIALPTMTIVPMIASLYGKEGPYTAGITIGTIAISMTTIPLVAFLV